MSNFICPECGKTIIDSPNGFITFCPHYKKEKQKEIFEESKNILHKIGFLKSFNK